MSGFLAPASPFTSLSAARAATERRLGARTDRYEVAMRALRAARTISDVVEIADRGSALREYARRAKNRDMESDAIEIRWRAERRLGEMLAGALIIGRPSFENAEKPRLCDIGINFNLSMRAQRLAGLAEPAFESGIASLRARAAGRGRLPTFFPSIFGDDPRPTRRRPAPTPESALILVHADPAPVTLAQLARAAMGGADPSSAISQIFDLLTGDPALLRAVITSAVDEERP